jgi:long-chain acyl-CoA synthetase
MGIKKPRRAEGIYRWGEFLKLGMGPYAGRGGVSKDVAAVLYSGGTTGRTKGILLTNLNFNALAILTARAGDCIVPYTKMLALMPVFHGFGLGINIHTALFAGVTALLVPRFTVKSYAKLLKKRKPHYIAGVPTLFEALLRLPGTGKIDLSMLRGVFSGGDMMPQSLRVRVDEFLKERGSPVGVREGYGLTECVTASCLTPPDGHRDGSIGLPFDDILFKIVEPDTQNELPLGETGEIVLSGPTVMLGYDGNEEETANTLQIHADGREWLHTGDLGSMDSDGYVYFRGRRKRMIITSGYNVYPYEIESLLGAHEYVKLCAVVGVPDEYRMQRVKAIIVLRDGAPPREKAIEELTEYCKKALAPFNRPREFEVRDELPTTLVGKVAYARLEDGDTHIESTQNP